SKPATTADTIEQHLMKVSSSDKKYALRGLLEKENVKNAFVFCNRKRDVDMLGKWLKEKGFSAAPLHGDMVQSVRTKTLQDFKDGNIVFLVCSDVAARGLDVIGVSHVFNYDVPINPDDYVHRIGRTGRAGQLGKAWTLWADDDDKFVEAIHKRIGKDIEIESYQKKAKEDKELKPFIQKKDKQEFVSNAKSAPPFEKKRKISDDDGPSRFTDDDLPAFLQRR
ncbi:MAG: hypothetical protein DI586_09940, partial [Micavibrio aeruginosavorus]